MLMGEYAAFFLDVQVTMVASLSNMHWPTIFQLPAILITLQNVSCETFCPGYWWQVPFRYLAAMRFANCSC
jgi:hypothetical protein